MPIKTLLAIFSTAALIWGVHLLPQLDWVKGPDLETLGRMMGIEPVPKTPEVTETPVDKRPPVEIIIPENLESKSPTEGGDGTASHPNLPFTIKVPDIATGPPTPVVDITGQMHFFYEALDRTQAKQRGSITRILHYGDSPVTADSITADARAILQSQYGDAGHGFVLIAKPWAWYMHRGVDITASGWKIDTASTTPRARDNLHGFGGVSFIGTPGSTSKITLPDTLHTKVEVLYLRQPNGGEFRIDVASETVATISTAGDDKGTGYGTAVLPEATSQVKLTVTRGTVRLFGIKFEKPGPGVVYSSLGLNGVSVQHLLRYFDPGQWSEQLQHENPDLIVINYGTNESVYPKYVDTMYTSELRQVLDRVHAAAPRSSILIMSPMDRGERKQGVIQTMPIMPRIVDLQQQIAMDSGCAFFNTFQAMGGAGTMARWYDNKPRLVNADYTHPLPGGAAVIGSLLDQALVEGYERWKGHRQ